MFLKLQPVIDDGFCELVLVYMLFIMLADLPIAVACSRISDSALLQQQSFGMLHGLKCEQGRMNILLTLELV